MMKESLSDMTRDKFASLMNDFYHRMKANDHFYNSLEVLNLSDIVEQMLEHDYADILIEALGETDKEQEWIRYLVYDCDFDLTTLNENVYINNSNLAVHNFGEFYDYIKKS